MLLEIFVKKKSKLQFKVKLIDIYTTRDAIYIYIQSMIIWSTSVHSVDVNMKSREGVYQWRFMKANISRGQSRYM